MSRTIKIVLFLSFGIYCAIYPGSIFVLFTNQVPEGTEWMASLMLFTTGIAAAAWVTLNFGLRRGFVAVLTVLFLGFLVETIGEITDFPFGAYRYTDVLAPKIFVVPIAITFAWLMIMLSSYFTARYLVHRVFPEFGQGLAIGLAVALAVTSDLLMEPVAFLVQNYWVWERGGFYYGVPLSNFIAWAITTLIMVLVFRKLTRLKYEPLDKPLILSFIPAALYLMNLFMFTGINVSRGYFLAGAIGAFALSFVGFVLIAPAGAGLQKLGFRRT
jgi:bisanhydrobacterioruberin hydratase